MTDDSEDVTTYRLTGSRRGRRSMRVDTGDATFDVDSDLNPVEYLLGSVIGCLNFTATRVAREMNVEIDDLNATVEGDVDYSAYKGEQTNARAGLQEIRVVLSVSTDADEETLDEWLQAVERRCPVSETVANGTAIGAAVERQ
jgi:uncharacterized OsmC-like protein